MRSFPNRDTRTGCGIFPFLKPGIFTLSERSDSACSIACCTWSGETSIVRRTRFSPSCSTPVVTRPFNQPEVGSRRIERRRPLYSAWHCKDEKRAKSCPQMAERYDAVVVGVGGMGSAALYHLARRGKRVLGLERFDVPNDMGSSHGITRIIRLAYFEHSNYLPLVPRAYELLPQLQAEAGEELLHITGIVEAGGRVYGGAVRSCSEHGIPYESIDGHELGRRYPAFRLPRELQVFAQADGGVLLPERC